jgi:glucan phosphoethanolaminetransferase (alkaline phosphatase superfamily)
MWKNFKSNKYERIVKNILLVLTLLYFERGFYAKSVYYFADIKYLSETFGLFYKLLYCGAILYIANNRWFYMRLFMGITLAVFFYADEVFKNITGGIITIPDLDMLLMSVSLWKETLYFYAPYILDIKIIAAVSLFLFAFIRYPKKEEKTDPFFEFFFQAGILTVFIVSIFSMPYDSDEYLDMYMPFIRIPAEVVLIKNNPIDTQRQELKEIPVKAPLIKNIIFVIDESINGEYVSENNHEVDLDFYSKYKDMIIDYGISMASVNCSYGSRSYFRFAVFPKDIENKTALSKPTIWQYANKAGFKTFLIGYTPLKDNLLTNQEVMTIDYFEHMSLMKYRPYYDVELAKKIKKYLKDDDNYKLFYVAKEGAHFPYKESYPADKSVYTPHLGKDDSMIDYEKVRNSYRNVLKWSVDGFFDELFKNNEIDMEQTMVIYTSDHGENIGRESERSLVPQTHCSTDNPNIEEFKVPLIVFTENPKLREMLSNQKGAHHFNIVATILKLMGYKTAEKSLFDQELGSYPSYYGDPYVRFEKIKTFFP